jgi:predicted dehydrogenase
MKKRLRGGVIGAGEVILEYAWKGYREAQRNGQPIDIVKIANVGSFEQTSQDLKLRHKERELERASIEDVLSEFGRGGLKHYTTDGGCFKDPRPFMEGLDFVYIATPNEIRLGFVQEAIDCGVIPIIEKPIAHTEALVGAVASYVDNHGIKAMCAEHYSYKLPALWMFKNIQDLSKRWGALESINGALCETDMLDAARYEWLFKKSGIWLDTGVHMMHAVYLAGVKAGEVTSAYGFRQRFPKGDSRNENIQGETGSVVRVNLESDRIEVAPWAYANIEVAKCAPKKKKFLDVRFEKGSLHLNFANNSAF